MTLIYPEPVLEKLVEDIMAVNFTTEREINSSLVSLFFQIGNILNKKLDGLERTDQHVELITIYNQICLVYGQLFTLAEFEQMRDVVQTIPEFPIMINFAFIYSWPDIIHISESKENGNRSTLLSSFPKLFRNKRKLKSHLLSVVQEIARHPEKMTSSVGNVFSLQATQFLYTKLLSVPSNFEKGMEQIQNSDRPGVSKDICLLIQSFRRSELQYLSHRFSINLWMLGKSILTGIESIGGAIQEPAFYTTLSNRLREQSKFNINDRDIFLSVKFVSLIPDLMIASNLVSRILSWYLIVDLISKAPEIEFPQHLNEKYLRKVFPDTTRSINTISDLYNHPYYHIMRTSYNAS